MTDPLAIKIIPAPVTSATALAYEFGARLDKDCLPAVHAQITKARRLYNEIIASMRGIVAELHAYVHAHASAEAKAAYARIETLNEEFAAAKARDDEDAMRLAAQQRREMWGRYREAIKATRVELKADIAVRLARIGNKSGCDTYALRCAAVADGLGWATANAVLEAALGAFKKTFALGRAPEFSRGADKTQDALRLQFTLAGGVPAQVLLDGAHAELELLPTNGCGRKKYGELRFRLGAASANEFATGTWQYDRPLPQGAHVGVARLIRRRIGKDDRWYVQLQLRLKTPARIEVGQRKALAAVHFGWTADEGGRRIAWIAEGADPGGVRVLQLPAEIEAGLDRAAQIQSARDAARNTVVERIKQTPLASLGWDAAEEVKQEYDAIRRLAPSKVAINRLYRLCSMLQRATLTPPDWLASWRAVDRLQWQDTSHIAAAKRQQRNHYYRNEALRLVREFEVIAIEPVDLKGSAQKVDTRTGEKNELHAKARAGRVVASLHEFELALRWAAARAQAAVLELSGPTVQTCCHCAGRTQQPDEYVQVLNCLDCGAVIELKRNAAAVGWQAANADLERLTQEYWQAAADAERKAKEAKALRLTKMAAGRKTARTQRERLDSPGSHTLESES
jgi:hypothetical protein